MNNEWIFNVQFLFDYRLIRITKLLLLCYVLATTYIFVNTYFLVYVIDGKSRLLGDELSYVQDSIVFHKYELGKRQREWKRSERGRDSMRKQHSGQRMLTQRRNFLSTRAVTDVIPVSLLSPKTTPQAIQFAAYLLI